jgi:hypothetical protein
MWADGGPRLLFGVRDATTLALLGMVEANTDWAGLGSRPREVNVSYRGYPRARRPGMAVQAVRLLLAHPATLPRT